MNFFLNCNNTGFYRYPPNEKGSASFSLPSQIPNQNHGLIFDKLSILLQKLCQKEPDLMATFILSNVNFQSTSVDEKKALVSEYSDLLQTKLQAQTLVRDILDNKEHENLENKELLEAFISDREGFEEVVLKISESINNPDLSWTAIQALYENFEFIGRSIDSTQAAGRLIQEYIKQATAKSEQSANLPDIQQEGDTKRSADTNVNKVLDEKTTDAVKNWALGVSKYNKIPGLFAKGIISAGVIATELKLTIEYARSNIQNLLVAAQRSGLFEGFESKTRNEQVKQLALVFKTILSPDDETLPKNVVVNSTRPKPRPETRAATRKDPLPETAVLQPTPTQVEASVSIKPPPPAFEIVRLPDALVKSLSLETETRRVLVDDYLWDDLRISLSKETLSSVVAIMNGMPINRALSLNYVTGISEEEFVSNICEFFHVLSLGKTDPEKFYDSGIKLGACLRWILFNGNFADHIDDVCNLRNKFMASDPASLKSTGKLSLNRNTSGQEAIPVKTPRPKKIDLRKEFDPKVREAELEKRRGEGRSKRYD